jgi:hypothetical protein
VRLQNYVAALSGGNLYEVEAYNVGAYLEGIGWAG